MNQSALSWQVDDGDILWLTMDVHGESVNTLQAGLIEEMEAFLDRYATDNSLKGLVIQSGKKDSFIAGADIHMLAQCQTEQEAQALSRQGQTIFERLTHLPYPTVAMIHGVCLGGGLELALACDYRVCSLDDKTLLGLPEIKLGLIPGSGGTQRLPRLIGLTAALDMMLTGRSHRALKAKRLGLVDECVSVDILATVAVDKLTKHQGKPRVERQLGVAQRWLTQVNLASSATIKLVEQQAQKKARHLYPAISSLCQVVKAGLEQGVLVGAQQEAEQFGKLVMSAESKALRHLFFATTALKKEGKVAESLPSLSQVGVIGSGFMGAGIALVSIDKAQLRTRIKDLDPQSMAKAMQYCYRGLKKAQKKGKYRPRQVEQRMQYLSADTQYRGFDQADIMVEAVVEDLDIKKNIVQDIQSLPNFNGVVATNTSSIPIADIASEAPNPEQVIGLHYFSPVEKMPLVEVIPHAGSSEKAVATGIALAKQQGKTAIVVKDSAGFYVNRILTPYMNEAGRILLENEPVDSIDKALLNFGFPLGPIKLIDEVGIDIGDKITPILVDKLGARFEPPAIFTSLLNDNRLGKKNQRGFYRYGKGRSGVDKSVYQTLNLKPESALSEKEIAERCVMLMLNEAVRCLDEGIITRPRDGDIGAIFGLGFPPCLGGPFHYMDAIGIKTLVSKLNALSERYGDRFNPADGLLTRAGNDEKFYPQ